MLEPFIGKQIGQLLSNHLNQFGFWDMVMDEACDAVYIPWEDNRKSHMEEALKNKRFPK